MTTTISGTDRRPRISVLARLRAFGEIVGVVTAFLVTANFLGPVLGVPLAALALYGGVLAGWGFLRLAGERWSDVGFRFPDRWQPVFAWSLGVGAAGLAAFLGVIGLQSVGLPALDLSLLRDAVRGDPVMFLATMVLVVWGSAAFAEELIFRGFILDRFERVFTGVPGAAWWAVLAQAGLFALAHSYQGVTGLLYSGTVALLFGAVYLARDRNLWIPILAHGLIDTVGITLLFLGLL